MHGSQGDPTSQRGGLVVLMLLGFSHEIDFWFT
jgi:hypothetical protein